MKDPHLSYWIGGDHIYLRSDTYSLIVAEAKLSSPPGSIVKPSF